MIAIPHNNAVLCKQLNNSTNEDKKDGIVFQRENLPLYEVVAVGENVKKIQLDVGDVIVSNSQPTKFNLDGTMFFLIHDDHIAGKVQQ